MAKRLKYPEDARVNGVMGLSAFSFKVGCDGKPFAFSFKTKIGFGIENEIEATIREMADRWIDCHKRDTSTWINFRIAFSINKRYDGNNADLVFNAHGPFPGLSDDQLKKDLERALKKGQNDKALEVLTKLFMRFPYDQEYRKLMLELRRKQ